MFHVRHLLNEMMKNVKKDGDCVGNGLFPVTSRPRFWDDLTSGRPESEYGNAEFFTQERSARRKEEEGEKKSPAGSRCL